MGLNNRLFSRFTTFAMATFLLTTSVAEGSTGSRQVRFNDACIKTMDIPLMLSASWLDRTQWKDTNSFFADGAGTNSLSLQPARLDKHQITDFKKNTR